MLGEHRQRRARLLTCAFAALALSAAFAGTAQAGLDEPTGQQDPIAATVGGATATVAGATTTVGEVTSTVTGTAGTATSTTPTAGDAVGTTASIATGVVSDATQTVSDTAEVASQTLANTTEAVTQTVSSTTQAVTSTVERAVAMGDTLGGVTTGSASTIEQGARQLVPPPAASPTLTAESSSVQPSMTVSQGSAAVPVPGTGIDALVDGTEPSRIAIAFTPLQPGEASTAATSQNRVVPETGSARPAGPQASPPAFLSTKPNGTRQERASVPRAPQAPLPGLPSSITALLGGSSASVWFGLAALLGALLLTAFGSPDTRLRPGAAVVCLPDVFSSLERPG